MSNRKPMQTCVTAEVKDKVDEAARKFQCSRNDIVEAVLLFFDTDTYERCLKFQKLDEFLKGNQ
ncbi:MAG: hypothetical protein M9949_06200 [Candidatus Kapabacteria bacterium]|nr:hypothetical protein [Candidatus Kapabacteria bacterium]